MLIVVIVVVVVAAAVAGVTVIAVVAAVIATAVAVAVAVIVALILLFSRFVNLLIIYIYCLQNFLLLMIGIVSSKNASLPLLALSPSFSFLFLIFFLDPFVYP